MKSDAVKNYWQSYLDSLPSDTPTDNLHYVAEYLGDLPDLANELATLIEAGTKTATCSALWEWEADGDPLPEIGHKTVVLNGDLQPLCIIEVTEVTVRPYDQVDAQFAFEEGEGDRSLEYWREAHWRFFSGSLPKIGKEPTQDMPLVCERFKVIYR